MILGLMSGGADAVVFNPPVVANFMQSNPGKVRVVGDLYTKGFGNATK